MTIEAIASPARPPWHARAGAWLRQPGVLVALPTTLFLLVGFAGPLAIVLVYSFMPSRTFSMFQAPTLANFVSVVTDSYYISFLRERCGLDLAPSLSARGSVATNGGCTNRRACSKRRPFRCQTP
jgi:ABC-type sugar transport system permease subunit